MKHNAEIACIYATGLLQGLVLVTLPAASLVFTDPAKFNFSGSEYGLLFIPQVLAAIMAALLGPWFSRTYGMKIIYQFSLGFNILAMGLIAASALVMPYHHIAYALVILGTSCVGAGFGSTLPIINVYATRFFPKNSASALTVLHTLLGIGTALAPFLVAIFVKQIGWWVLPIGVGSGLIILLSGSFILSLSSPAAEKQSADAHISLPLQIKLFMLIVLLYGFCETIFANWAIIFLNKEKGFPVEQAGYALASFWLMVSAGRLLISILSIWISPKWIYQILPILITGSLLAVTKISSPWMGIMLFGAAGLSCSAFFPLSFNFAQKGFESMAEKSSGWLMASYMFGYGCAAYGVGKMVELTHGSFSGWYMYAMVPALGLIFLSCLLMAKVPKSNS